MLKHHINKVELNGQCGLQITNWAEEVNTYFYNTEQERKTKIIELACKDIAHAICRKHNDKYANELYWTLVEGKKYFKILTGVITDGDSVHAFVDKLTGAMYKPASWAKPAKGARYNVIADYEKLIEVATHTGGYLYR